MKWRKYMAPFLESAMKQLAGPFHGLWKYEPDKREIHFTNKCLRLLREYSLSENDVLDVYYHGHSIGREKMKKKYAGYEIGIFYMIANDTGVVVITHVWKKDRR